MYIVMEIQKSNEGTLSTLVTTHDTKNKAENSINTIFLIVSFFAKISNISKALIQSSKTVSLCNE